MHFYYRESERARERDRERRDKERWLKVDLCNCKRWYQRAHFQAINL